MEHFFLERVEHDLDGSVERYSFREIKISALNQEKDD